MSATAAGSAAGPFAAAISSKRADGGGERLAVARDARGVRKDRTDRGWIGGGRRARGARWRKGPGLHAVDRARDDRGVDGCLGERIAREPVRAVEPSRGRFAAGPEPRDRAPPLGVHGDPAHVIVLRRPHRDRLARRIDARGVTSRSDSREARGEFFANRGARVEESTAA